MSVPACQSPAGCTLPVALHILLQLTEEERAAILAARKAKQIELRRLRRQQEMEERRRREQHSDMLRGEPPVPDYGFRVDPDLVPEVRRRLLLTGRGAAPGPGQLMQLMQLMQLLMCCSCVDASEGHMCNDMCPHP